LGKSEKIDFSIKIHKVPPNKFQGVIERLEEEKISKTA